MSKLQLIILPLFVFFFNFGDAENSLQRPMMFKHMIQLFLKFEILFTSCAEVILNVSHYKVIIPKTKRQICLTYFSRNTNHAAILKI